MSNWKSTTRKERDLLDQLASSLPFGEDAFNYVTYLENSETGEVIRGYGANPEDSQRRAREKLEYVERERKQAAIAKAKREEQQRIERASARMRQTGETNKVRRRVSISYIIGEKLGELLIFLLTVAFGVPGFVLDKLFPSRDRTSRLWLYSLFFWVFVGATIYLERLLGTSVWSFGVLLVLISLLNIAMGVAASEDFIKPRVIVARRFFGMLHPAQPWIGWSGFVVGLFSLIWSLASHWPPTTLLSGVTGIIAGAILVRPIQASIGILKFCIGMGCVAMAFFQLIFGWNFSPASGGMSFRDGEQTRIVLQPIVQAPRKEAQGQNVNRGTATVSAIQFPSVPPLIAFVSRSEGENGRGMRAIWVMRADGAERRRLTGESEGAFNPVWSPDGATLLFRAGELGDYYLIDRDGNNRRPLLDWSEITVDFPGASYKDLDAEHAWKPDSKKIAFAVFDRRLRNGSHVYFLDSSTRKKEVIQLGKSVCSLFWSPDGNWLAFLSFRDSPGEGGKLYKTWFQVWVADSSAFRPVPITEELDRPVLPKWLPDGKWLVYLKDREWVRQGQRGFNTKLCLKNVSDGQSTEVDIPFNITSIDVCPVGQMIALSTLQGSVIHIFRLIGTVWTEHAAIPRAQLPSWSPDGAKITFISTEDSQVWCANADGTDRFRLTVGEVSEGSTGGKEWPQWSPGPCLQQQSESIPGAAESLQITNDMGKLQPPPESPAASSIDVVALPQYNWDMAHHTGAGNENASLDPWLDGKLKEKPVLAGTLVALARTIQRQADGCATTIFDYSKRGQTLWAVGAYTTTPMKLTEGAEDKDAKEEDKHGIKKGFICRSSDGGKAWVRQWFCENDGSDAVQGIYFADSQEGWALTHKGVLYTSNGGGAWKRMFVSPIAVGDLFILEKGRWKMTDANVPNRRFYLTMDDGRTWDEKTIDVLNAKELMNTKKRSGGSALHHGGVYSYQGSDKE